MSQAAGHDLESGGPRTLAENVLDSSPNETTSQMDTSERDYSKWYFMDTGLKGGHRWLVLFSAFVLFVQQGFSYTSSLYIQPISDEFNVNRSTSSAVSTFGFVSQAVACISGGALANYFGVRQTVFVAQLFYIGGIFLSSYADSLGLFFFLFGVFGPVGQGTLYMAALTIQPDWFPDRLGLAYGISLSGLGAGNFAFTWIVQQTINSGGWRYANKVVSIIMVFLALIMLALLRKKTPSGWQKRKEAKAAQALAQTEGKSIDSTEPKESSFQTLKKSLDFLKQRSVIWFLVSQLFMGFPFYAPFVHLVPFATDMGLSDDAASSLLMFISLAAMAGRLGGGYFCDRYGGVQVYEVSCGGLGVCMFFWIFCTNQFLLSLLSIGFGLFGGIAVCSTTAAASMLVGAQKGPALVGFSYGTMWIPGCGLTSYFMGAIHDSTGTYTAASFTLFGFGIISLAASWLSLKNHQSSKLVEETSAPLPDFASTTVDPLPFSYASSSFSASTSTLAPDAESPLAYSVELSTPQPSEQSHLAYCLAQPIATSHIQTTIMVAA